MGAAWELERLASREGGSAKVVSGATRDFGPTRRQECPYSGFSSSPQVFRLLLKTSVERNTNELNSIFGRLCLLAEPCEFVKRQSSRVRGEVGLCKESTAVGGCSAAASNREVKKGLAPFTPRIDLALQCRWERCSLLSTCGQKKKTCSAFQGVSQMGRPPGVTLSTPADFVAASRHRGQRFHPATGPFYRSPRCPSPFLAPRSRSASS
ncbi:hypothetical protein Q8A73_016901 [Channa argus]|nr:hypothetical protein Q8A73_016894 [Channa argus]KAK2877931.1 hypothetical protein Q8A73_016901 [Channa argus]